MVLSAIANGFDSIGFSAHSSISGYDISHENVELCREGSILYTDPSKSRAKIFGFVEKEGELFGMLKRNMEPYRQKVLELADKYKDKINIFLGIELDSLASLSDIPAGARYIIGSVHYVEQNGSYIANDYSVEMLKKGVEELFDGDYLAYAESYYKELERVYDKTLCDIVGHADIICKFNERERLIDESHSRYRSAAFGAVESLARRGLIFEINTGAIGRGYRTEPYPSEDLLRVIRESGGKVTYSSDCHKADAIAVAFEESVALAKKCGFKSFMKLGDKGFYEEEL